MRVEVDLINDVMLGIELGEDEDGNTVIVIDFFILRFLIGCINHSVGILVEENSEHITIAQTAFADGSQYADLVTYFNKRYN